MIRAGLLDEVLTVLRYKKTVDRYGADSGQWVTVTDDVSCSVAYKERGYGEVNGEVVYSHVTEFTMRYTDIVREYDRVVWDGRVYQVEGIDRRRRYGEMTVKCSFIDNQENEQ